MDPIFSSITELETAILTRQVSAVEVLEALLAQIERHNPALNAVVTLDIERAKSRAREADAALARGEVWGPLHGVPFTLKDAFATQGVRTTSGFPPLADYIPSKDSTVAARLKLAGGILMGKTNVPVMLGDFQTANPIFGRSNNPWNVERTPGGSSGGAAAALAAGMTPFEVGSDLAGSARIPAHFCGVYALKTTEHRVSLEGLIPGLPPPRPVRIMSTIAPMARTVEDLALIYRIIAGPDEEDTDVPPVLVDIVTEPVLKNLRVAFAASFPGLPVSEEIQTAIHELAQRLKPLCGVVEEAPLPGLDFMQDLANAGALIDKILGAFQPAENKPAATLAEYLKALHQRDQSIQAWERFFDRWDILLCPPAMTSAFPHSEMGAPLRVNGREVEYGLISAYCTLFNYTGHPAVVLPYQRDRDGLPLGVQLVGKRWDEGRLLAIAKAFTRVTGHFQRPPGY